MSVRSDQQFRCNPTTITASPLNGTGPRRKDQHTLPIPIDDRHMSGGFLVSNLVCSTKQQGRLRTCRTTGITNSTRIDTSGEVDVASVVGVTNGI